MQTFAPRGTNTLLVPPLVAAVRVVTSDADPADVASVAVTPDLKIVVFVVFVVRVVPTLLYIYSLFPDILEPDQCGDISVAVGPVQFEWDRLEILLPRPLRDHSWS